MKTWKCGRFDLPLGRKTYVMGIINATPDSFSGDGTWNDIYSNGQSSGGATSGGATSDASQNALALAERMVEDGADMLDIGGESTRPGAQPVSASEELRRVLPLVEILAPRFDLPISVDTTKSQVARACLDAGASIINDVSSGTFDSTLLPAIAPFECGVILMHLRGTPQTMKASAAFNNQIGDNRSAPDSERAAAQSTATVEDQAVYDVIAEITSFWAERVRAAQEVGIAPQRICLDAGFGFGKSLEENLEILRRGRELSQFGFPTLSAISRKSTLGRVLAQAQRAQPARHAQQTPKMPKSDAAPDVPSHQRQWATAAGVALAIAGGCDIVRVHDVREMVQVARMADAATRT